MEFVIEKLKEKGYVTFREIMELDLVPVDKIEDLMEEIAKTIDLAERENGRRYLAVHTRKGFAIVEYIRNGDGLFRVPRKLEWELKPEIVGVG